LVTSGTVWSGMSLTPTTATLGTLVQGTTYDFDLTFSDPSSIKYGFELCVLPGGANSSSASLGTLVSSTLSTQLVSAGTRTYLQQTSSGTSAPSNSKTWSFQWTPPASYTGGATFYVVVNSTDNSSSPTPGDVIYAKTFAATVTLPVSWLYTKASIQQNEVVLNWATASEENNWKFVVEKSSNKENWEVLGEVAGKGNSSVVNKYTFRGQKERGIVYYRVKQVDFNGKFSYSDIVMTKSDEQLNRPTVSYNPDQLRYIIKGEQLHRVVVKDIKGQTRFESNGAANEHFIPALESGIYVVQITTEKETYFEKVLMY
jgi:hypothetical protein